jgi:GTP-binding protein
VLSGITDLDDTVASMLRKSKKKVFLVVNKIDNGERLYDANVFYKLGLGDIFPVSSLTGSGTGDLLDKVVESFPNEPLEEEEINVPKFAIVGRPNVGKSSLINTLVGEERNIVTPVSGTTRDSIHTRYTKFGHDFIVIDTAGLRKKGKVFENIEFYSVMRSIRSIEDSDVCLLLIDATQGIESQDVNIFHLIEKNKKGLVILVNKWDLVEKDHKTTLHFSAYIKEKIAPFVDVPIVFTSAITKQRIFKVLETAMEVYHNRKKVIATSKLNEIMLEAIKAYPPPSLKGKFVKIKFVTQLPSQTPSFAFFCNLPQYVREPYKRYLENRLRENFDFKGVPIQIYMRAK